MSQPDALTWSQIDTVLLDMDGTLLDLHFDSFFWLEHLPVRYAQIHQCDLAEAKAYLLTELSKNRGSIQWYCVDHWSEKLKLDIAALRAEVSHNVGYRPFAKEFLQLLQRSPAKVVLVTNDHRSGLELKLAITGLAEYLDAIVVSHDFCVAKEQQKFWREMQKVEPFDPERSLFIDDTLAVLHSAKRYGIKHLRAISQPDSKIRRNIDTEFRQIGCFSAVNKWLELALQAGGNDE